MTIDLLRVPCRRTGRVEVFLEKQRERPRAVMACEGATTRFVIAGLWHGRSRCCCVYSRRDNSRAIVYCTNCPARDRPVQPAPSLRVQGREFDFIARLTCRG